MKKRKSIVIPMMLAAAVAAVSVPGSSQDVMASDTYQVSVSKGYLALRNAMAYDSSNEIGELYSGDTVEVTDYTTSDYWYVYSPKLGKSGYVNNNYLIYLSGQSAAPASGSYTVRVSKGYLALRSAKAYDSSNEIGELYTGDTVTVSDSSDSQYWYVYSPKLGKSGYVNKDYLYYNGSGTSTQSTSGDTRTVIVSKGYLALRSAKAYDSSNEIGELYTGDTVTVSDSSDPQYWYVYSPKLNKYGYVNKGYLALRSAKAYDSSNEIGELYTGDTVTVSDSSDPQYWYVYSPKLNKYGYVNKDYLSGGTATYSNTYPTKTVSVATGYLALRSAKAYDTSNEIGELYSGETVQVIDSTDAQYWYVYSTKLGRYGYVNKDYLY